MGAGSVLLGKQLADLVVGAANFADKIVDVSTATGMSIESVQRLEHAATASGVSMEKVTGAVIKMQRALVDSPEKLERLGLSFDALKDLAPEQQLETIANRLALIQDPAERNALAVQLFGKSWAELSPLLLGGLDAMKDVNVISTEQIKHLDELRNRLNVVSAEWEKMWVQVGGGIADATDASDIIKRIGEAIRDLSNLLKSFPAMPESLATLLKAGKAVLSGATAGVSDLALDLPANLKRLKELEAKRENDNKMAAVRFMGDGDLKTGFDRMRDGQMQAAEEAGDFEEFVR